MLIQEGVYTFESINDAVAEPVVYMVDHFVVGGFYRVHTGRGADENLNSPGMHFVPLAFDASCQMPDRSANPDATPNRFYAYGVIARLAMLAASIELDEALNERGMKLLFIVDPLDGLKPYKDSSVAMMRAAAARGHAVFAAEARQLHVEDGIARAACAALDVRPTTTGSASAAPTRCAVRDFDAVLMRTDPPVDTDYLLATHLLGLAEANGARVLNRPAALRDFNEKLAILNFPQFVAPTLVSADAAGYRRVSRRARRHHRQAAYRNGRQRHLPPDTLRPQPQRHPRNTHPVTAAAPSWRSAICPEIAQGDKRILIIDGEVVPWALARIPKDGETRGNLAAGGAGRAQPLSPRDREIAETIAPWARAQRPVSRRASTSSEIVSPKSMSPARPGFRKSPLNPGLM